MTAIDLYSGIGGWTIGLKMCGIDVLRSYEWWKDANDTHNKNFGTNHKEFDIRGLTKKDLPLPSEVNFVVGSPPCTQFSFSNRGGNGDIQDGLVDVKKFLEIVQYLEPKYWAMENVPRVAGILEKELNKGGSLHKYRSLFNNIKVYNSSDFGVPQDRKRMIAGNFPFDLFESYRQGVHKKSLANVLENLSGTVVKDPIYGIELDRREITDHIKEQPLSNEESWINSQGKTHHPVYNLMSFPDNLNRPSRTVTAVCTRVSRESIIIPDGKDFRRLTVRERACLQSFPISYQLFSASYTGKIRMVGNAIPPLLTFYIGQAMLETKPENILRPEDVSNRLPIPIQLATNSIPEKEGNSYPITRSFWFAINGLRFGSGIRFELRNYFKKDESSTNWRINFFYGNSKSIKQKQLNYELLNNLLEIIPGLKIDSEICAHLQKFREIVKDIDEHELQLHWSHRQTNAYGPVELLGQISKRAIELNATIESSPEDHQVIQGVVQEVLINNDLQLDNKNILNRSNAIFTGLLMGSYFNTILAGQIRYVDPELLKINYCQVNCEQLV